jgi:hypothetical protein
MPELQTREHGLTADLAGEIRTKRAIDGSQFVKGQHLEIQPLFSESEMGEFRSRWSSLQTGFVDEPRRTVEDADTLVAAVMQRLTEGLLNERSGLDKQWDKGEDVSTEDLRVALQRYRSFFDRLLKL